MSRKAPVSNMQSPGEEAAQVMWAPDSSLVGQRVLSVCAPHRPIWSPLWRSLPFPSRATATLAWP